MIHLPFADRAEAGRLLANELRARDLPGNVVVLALPRGGLPVGHQIAQALGAPLDVVIVRKLGVPWQPELAMGAIASGSFHTLDRNLIETLQIPREQIDAIVARESAEVVRREILYRRGRPALDLRGQTVLLVDDGLATGSTMLVAARYVRSLEPDQILIAVPVGSVQACRTLGRASDDCICLATPVPFHAVGAWYTDFRQVTDAEVQHILEQNRHPAVMTSQPELQKN
jgi:predicted phosphoribosyltransferase